jgi:excisionase family DNA binding protein
VDPVSDTTSGDVILDTEDVARWLATSVRHVQRMVAEKGIPYVKVGRFVRFDSREVTRWIDEQKVDGGAGSPHPTVIVSTQRQVALTASSTRRPTSATEVLARWHTQAR